jgi:hemerythrin-like domain-containing protein
MGMISVDQLQSVPSSLNTLDTPLEHLQACHHDFLDRLTILEYAAAQLNSQPAEARLALQSAFRLFEIAGALHTRDEEISLFPRLDARVSPDERAYLMRLQVQHREAEAVYELLHDVPNPGDDLTEFRAVVRRFCQIYRAHVQSENEQLFAMARRVLDDQDFAAIAEEMRQRRGL